MGLDLVWPKLEREEELAKMKENMLKYITMRIEYHTGREVLER